MFDEESSDKMPSIVSFSSSVIYGRGPHRLGGTPGAHGLDRVTELELENARLHRLVAELLLKNQQLRNCEELED